MRPRTDDRKFGFFVVDDVDDADNGENERNKVDDLENRPEHIQEHPAKEPYDDFDDNEQESLLDMEFNERVVLRH